MHAEVDAVRDEGDRVVQDLGRSWRRGVVLGRGRRRVSTARHHSGSLGTAEREDERGNDPRPAHPRSVDQDSVTRRASDRNLAVEQVS